MNDFPINELLKQIRQVEKTKIDGIKKRPDFQDNFARFMSCMLQAQYHLDILNYECFNEEFKHEIIITNLKDVEKWIKLMYKLFVCQKI